MRFDSSIKRESYAESNSKSGKAKGKSMTAVIMDVLAAEFGEPD